MIVLRETIRVFQVRGGVSSSLAASESKLSHWGHRLARWAMITHCVDIATEGDRWLSDGTRRQVRGGPQCSHWCARLRQDDPP